MARKPAPVSTFTETNRDNLRNTAFHGASATTRAVELLRTIGEKTFRKHEAELRDDFKAGYVAGYLAPKGTDNLSTELLKQAVAILAKPNTKSSKPNRRTEAQEAAVSAAKVAWSRVLERAGLASSSPKAKNRNASKPGSNKPDADDKPAAPIKDTDGQPITPTYNSRGDLLAYYMRQADTGFAMAQKHSQRKDSAQQPLVTASMMAIITAYRDAWRNLTTTAPVKDNATASTNVVAKPYKAPPAPTNLPAPVTSH